MVLSRSWYGLLRTRVYALSFSLLFSLPLLLLLMGMCFGGFGWYTNKWHVCAVVIWNGWPYWSSDMTALIVRVDLLISVSAISRSTLFALSPRLLTLHWLLCCSHSSSPFPSPLSSPLCYNSGSLTPFSLPPPPLSLPLSLPLSTYLSPIHESYDCYVFCCACGGLLPGLLPVA